MCFWHHSNTFRFAVVLFLQIEGECEREMGGNPLPLPPLTSVSDPDYPLPPLAGRAPWRPMSDLTNFFVPKARKVDLGLPERAKTSYTYAKVRLGRFGSAKVQKVQLFALLRFGPPRTGKNAVHVCKNAKVTFCNFFIFRKIKSSITF